MGIEPTSPGLNPGVLSRLNYGTVREAEQTSSADRGCGFVAIAAKSDGQVARSNGGTPCRESNPDRQGFRHGRYALLMVEDNRSSSAHRNWGGQTDSHRHQRLHRALCCYYTMTTMKWSAGPQPAGKPGVSGRTRTECFAETQRQNGVHGRNRTCDLHLRGMAL